MPATWAHLRRRRQRRRRKDPYNPVDAIFAAARYLKAAGGQKDLRRAIFAYNHADWYVDSVLLRARLDRRRCRPTSSARSPASRRGTSRSRPARATPVSVDLGRGRAARKAAATPPWSTAEHPHGRDRHLRRRARSGGRGQRRPDRRGWARTRRLGRYVTLQDVYGNTLHLRPPRRRSRRRYPAPRPQTAERCPGGPRAEAAPPRRPLRAPASAGRQRRRQRQPAARAAPGRRRPAARRRARVAAAPSRPQGAPVRPPGAPDGLPRGRRSGSSTPPGTGGRWRRDLQGLLHAAGQAASRSEVVLKPLKPGATVIAGTILGRVGAREAADRRT